MLELDDNLRARKKGNRLGIFLTVLGLALSLVGITHEKAFEQPEWVTVTTAAGFSLLAFGYLLARLWYWFRAA